MTYLLYLEIGSVAMYIKVNFTNSHSDECFMQDTTFFKDASHLNDKGARMFTANVVRIYSSGMTFIMVAAICSSPMIILI